MKKFYRKLYKSRLSRNYIMVWLMIYIMKKLARTKIRLKATYEYSCTTIVPVIFYLNYYRSITKFRNNFADAVFSDSLQLNFKTTFHLYVPIPCSNPECFIHTRDTQFYRFFIFTDNINFDFFPATFFKKFVRSTLRISYNRFFKSLRSCSKNDDDKSNCYALA